VQYTILNVHTPHEDNSSDVEDSFHEELGHAFDQLPRYKMKILLDEYNMKEGKMIFSKQQSGARLHMKLELTMELSSTLSHIYNFSCQKYNTVSSQHSYIHLDLSKGKDAQPY
jgi:hypothetical protein